MLVSETILPDRDASGSNSDQRGRSDGGRCLSDAGEDRGEVEALEEVTAKSSSYYLAELYSSPNKAI